MNRLITAPADHMSPAEFFRNVFGDPNDLTGCPMAAGYFLRDGAWMLIRPHHYWEQTTEVKSDPLPDAEAA